MITKGIIKDINIDSVSVEILGSEEHGEGGSCTTGDCASCSAAGKRKLVKAVNANKLSIRKGALIEMELSSAKALLAAFRVLILPLILFILGFVLAGNVSGSAQGIQVAAGFAGLGAGLLLNLLVSKKNKLKEMPVIIKVF